MHAVEFFELTQAAPDRPGNADAVAHWTVAGDFIFAVAHGFTIDGRGDPEAAIEASGLAMEALDRQLATLSPASPVRSRLQRAVQGANVEVYQKALTVPELRQMRTTLTVAALSGDALACAHVGDARLFLLRNQLFTQLTKDHTWTWDPLLAGGHDRTPGQGRPRRYAFPRCLGQELIVSVDVLTTTARAGDILLQCTPGLHEGLPDEELHEALTAHPPEAACRALVHRLRLSDGRDDAAVQTLAVGAADEASRGWGLGWLWH